MTKCKVIALANQKGGTAKTTTTLNLGIGLAHQGRKVLLVDADPQGDLTTALGWNDADNLPITLATQMKKILQDEPFVYNEGILHHEEGVDIIPTNIELSGMEISLVNAMSREQTLKLYLADLKTKPGPAVVFLDRRICLSVSATKIFCFSFKSLGKRGKSYLASERTGTGILEKTNGAWDRRSWK